MISCGLVLRVARYRLRVGFHDLQLFMTYSMKL